MKIFNWLRRWFQKLFAKPDFKKIHFVSGISQIPNNIKNDFYIVERSGRQLWLVFNCPCKSGHRLTVNLSRERNPSWFAEIKDNRLSVYPSVWVGDECQSHFWIKNSNISHTLDH